MSYGEFKKIHLSWTSNSTERPGGIPSSLQGAKVTNLTLDFAIPDFEIHGQLPDSRPHINIEHADIARLSADGANLVFLHLDNAVIRGGSLEKARAQYNHDTIEPGAGLGKLEPGKAVSDGLSARRDPDLLPVESLGRLKHRCPDARAPASATCQATKPCIGAITGGMKVKRSPITLLSMPAFAATRCHCSSVASNKPA